ncbi:MAG: hypothetical protein JWN26_844 [Candidatus Saccharibacteria bacterium]|nr:hypothetical protein [Candidatus Saccharibacteria bacterium]
MELNEIKLKPQSRTLTHALDIDNEDVAASLNATRDAVGGQDITVRSREYVDNIYPGIRDAIRNEKISLDQAALILREVGILKFK